MNMSTRIRRRHFLVGAGGTAVLGASGASVAILPAIAQDAQGGSLPSYADWKNPEAMVIHTELTLETVRDAIGTSVVTSNDVFFIRNNLNPPSEEVVQDRDAWEVSFEGVANPRTMTLGELKTLGLETVATIIQCSGNGRGLFDHDASGAPWRTGAAGCAVWSGVPVRAVAEELGGSVDGARFMTSTGGEELPEEVNRDEIVVERSVPLEAMENAILAFEMNGAPVPIAHGGPLRMIVPGYYGINNVKYVRTVAFTEEESTADIQVSGYRVRPVGESGAPDQPSMWDMKVKSWVIHPLMETTSGRVLIYGVAFGGTNPVERVEVSTDGGETWEDAEFTGPDLGRFAWRVFVLPAELEPGDYTVTSRATDSQGNVQEQTTEPNHRAYDYAGWDRLAVGVTVV
ncbi:sulfite oxidase [Chelativorans salis]|uniref:Sulfite oxidase n=1 Tax=Chelativorans salis TaxID=2978478 RepID=A0ABT2LV66_9HYPH|nr:sulfite oxidase [Chelativorans sp. EGI FJ00035]MCT7378428.1 sulfite oxidase [Chelativorans sp. EGI FJ00035]